MELDNQSSTWSLVAKVDLESDVTWENASVVVIGGHFSGDIKFEIDYKFIFLIRPQFVKFHHLNLVHIRRKIPQNSIRCEINRVHNHFGFICLRLLGWNLIQNQEYSENTFRKSGEHSLNRKQSLEKAKPLKFIQARA